MGCLVIQYVPFYVQYDVAGEVYWIIFVEHFIAGIDPSRVQVV